MQISRDCHNHLRVSFPQGSPGAPGKLTQPSDPKSAQTNKLKTKPTKDSTHKYLQRSRETPNFTGGKEHVGFKLLFLRWPCCVYTFDTSTVMCSGRGPSRYPGDGQATGTTLTGHWEPKKTPSPPATSWDSHTHS